MVELWSTEDLQSIGIDQAEQYRMMRSGTLVRLRRGWFRNGGSLSPQEQHLALIEATYPELSPDSVISHTSAAVLHGIPVPSHALGRVSVTRRGAGHGNHRPLLWASDSKLDDDDVVLLRGMRVTSIERTVADTARVVPYDWAVAAVDAHLRLSGSPDARESLLARIRRERKRGGNTRARAAAMFADPLAESPGESISRVIFAQEGLPKPVLQYEVWDSGRLVGRSDFAWEEHRTLGEFDGAIKYSGVLDGALDPTQAIMAEKSREQGFRDAGYWVTRWGWQDLRKRGALAAQIWRALGWASRR